MTFMTLNIPTRVAESEPEFFG